MSPGPHASTAPPRTPLQLLGSPLSTDQIVRSLTAQALKVPARFSWMAISEPDLYCARAVIAVNQRGE